MRWCDSYYSTISLLHYLTTLPAHTPDSVAPAGAAAIYLTQPGCVAAPGLAGVTHLHRRCCDETKPFDQPLARSETDQSAGLRPGPLTLLPVARSPSRPHCCAPLAGSCPAVSALTSAAEGDREGRPYRRDGFTFCCGCSRPAIALRTPPLTVSWGNLLPAGSGSREVPPRKPKLTGRRLTGK